MRARPVLRAVACGALLLVGHFTRWLFEGILRRTAVLRSQAEYINGKSKTEGEFGDLGFFRNFREGYAVENLA